MRTSAALLVLLASAVMAGEPQVTFHFRPDQPTLLNRPLAEFRDVVRSLAFFHDQVWVGTYGRGVFVLKDGSAPATLTASSSALLEDRVNCLEVAGGDLWVGTCAGINRVDGKTGAWSKYGVKDGVIHTIYHAIRHDAKGRIWVGTTGHGISRFDGKSWVSWGIHEGLPSGWVNDLAEDASGRMWAATAGGLASFDGTSWHVLPPTGAIGKIWTHATALAVRGNEIWVGTGGQGLLMTDGTYWYDPGSEAKLPSHEVSSLLVDRAGKLWVGTARGLVRYDGSGEWRKYGPEQGLEDPHVMILREGGPSSDGTAPDGHGGMPSRVWAGSYGGLVYRLDPEKDTWVTVLRKGGATK